ncbi:MAG TPA: FAD:protein FMN transferase [Acidimicrobiales bacterium]|nr:FAD:protein FMN transferase [Acidimicrobiales bacterium]
MTAFHSFRALGCTAVVGATDPRRLDHVLAVVADEISACDLACSRFRDDSELARANAGAANEASVWFCDAVAAALDAAADTDGLVDPTIGQCLVDLGYDRSFEQLDPSAPLVVRATHVPAWRKVRVDRARRRVTVPAGVRLDLGATAKALCADRAAARAAAATGGGVLVSLGGDIAVAGAPPADGWDIRVTDRSDTAPGDDRHGQTVAIRTGGLATSGTTARRWARADAQLHHLVDPRTGAPAGATWRTASVAAATCVAANVASTAAIVLGPDAPDWLARRGLDARVVTPDGAVVRVGGWPADLPEGVAA